jgi:hypothetical protein
MGNYFILSWSSYSHVYISRFWGICPDEVYVDVVYEHTKPSRVVCMSSMQVYIEYMVVLILYSIVVAF